MAIAGTIGVAALLACVGTKKSCTIALTHGLKSCSLMAYLRKYGVRPQLGSEAAQGVGYKEVIAHLDGEYDLEHAIYQVSKNTRRLAKHQRTWYRRFTDMHWLPGDAADLVDRAETIAIKHCWN